MGHAKPKKKFSEDMTRCMVSVSNECREPKNVHTGKNSAFIPRESKLRDFEMFFLIFIQFLLIQGKVNATKNRKIHKYTGFRRNYRTFLIK